METVRFFLGGVLPYVAVVVFITAMIRRINLWRKLPSPPMTLFPAPETVGEARVNTLKEAVFFRSLFKGDRTLWGLAWAFHIVLLLIFVGHTRVFTNVDGLLMKFGMGEESISAMSAGAGGTAGVVILVAAILLLGRRLLIGRVREITGIADYLALVLIGAILVSGNMMRFGPEHMDLVPVREYFAGLAMFRGVGEAGALQNNVFLVHMTLAWLLVLYIPFSKLLHFGGIFFTHQLIRKP